MMDDGVAAVAVETVYALVRLVISTVVEKGFLPRSGIPCLSAIAPATSDHNLGSRYFVDKIVVGVMPEVSLAYAFRVKVVKEPSMAIDAAY